MHDPDDDNAFSNMLEITGKVYDSGRTMTLMEQECEFCIVPKENVEKAYNMKIPSAFAGEQGNVLLVVDWANSVIWVVDYTDVIDIFQRIIENKPLRTVSRIHWVDVDGEVIRYENLVECHWCTAKFDYSKHGVVCPYCNKDHSDMMPDWADDHYGGST
jgi:hypothetical protein